MIYLKATGRLGNQFFQYAFTKYLKKRTGQDILITFDRVKKFSQYENDGWENGLKHFCANDYTEIYYTDVKYFWAWIKLKLIRVLINIENRIYPMKQSHGEKYGVIYCYNPKETRFSIKQKRNYILDGLFEYDYIVDDVLEELKEELKTNEQPYLQNKELYEQIIATQSICVTVRKFDLEDEAFTDYYQVCSLEYYYRGVEYILQRYPNATLFVFSDAIEWCKDNFNFEERFPDTKVYFETMNNSVGEKLRLMTSCKHFVISNSTFSWWAQKLSDSQNKIVCAPRRWNKDYLTSDIGLYCNNWILLDN